MADFTELIDAVNSKVLSAIEASEAGDNAAALQLMEEAEMALAVIPDGEIEDASVEWDREAISRSIATLRRRTGRKGGVVTMLVRHERG
jgi:hypothetical protein